MPDCKKQLWLVFSHLCFLNVRSMKPWMCTGRGGKRETRAMDENNREGGKGGMNMWKYIMQLWENDVKPEFLRPLAYLVFPFHSLTEQETKARTSVRVVVRGAATASLFISHIQWTCHQRRLGFLKGPKTGWFWSSEGRMVCSWILKQFCLCVPLLLSLSVCALSVLKGLFHAAHWRVLHYPSHKRTSSVVLWTF